MLNNITNKCCSIHIKTEPWTGGRTDKQTEQKFNTQMYNQPMHEYSVYLGMDFEQISIHLSNHSTIHPSIQSSKQHICFQIVLQLSVQVRPLALHPAGLNVRLSVHSICLSVHMSDCLSVCLVVVDGVAVVFLLVIQISYLKQHFHFNSLKIEPGKGEEVLGYLLIDSMLKIRVIYDLFFVKKMKKRYKCICWIIFVPQLAVHCVTINDCLGNDIENCHYILVMVPEKILHKMFNYVIHI